MEEKLRGVEHELAMNTGPGLPHGSLVHLVGMAIEELKKKGLVTGIKVEEPRLDFMAYNGFRVYDDMSHLELSSPSYNSSIEAVIYDRVCELFTYYAVDGLRNYFRTLNAYKNNVSNRKTDDGWTAVSYSTHSSILMSRKVCNMVVWGEMEKALIPFMVCRVPLIGGGDYVPVKADGSPARPGKIMKGDRLAFTISPRAMFVKRLSSNDTVDARGLLNQRNDPHADPTKYWRFHDIGWEALRSPYQVYMRDSLETLVMSAYEKGYLKNPPKIEDPVNAIKRLSLDVETCDWKVKVEGEGWVDALADVMDGYYLVAVERMLDEEESNDYDWMSFNLIDATIHGLMTRDLDLFVDGIDWITKKKLVDEYAGDLEEAIGIINQYNLIDDTVLGYLGEDVEESLTTFSLEDSWEFAKDAIPIEDWGSLDQKIKYALLNGPDGSRDYLRCLVAREFPGLLESIEWERINFYNVSIDLNEPFRFNREMCGDKLEKATGSFMEFSRALSEVSENMNYVSYAPIDDYEAEEV